EESHRADFACAARSVSGLPYWQGRWRSRRRVDIRAGLRPGRAHRAHRWKAWRRPTARSHRATTAARLTPAWRVNLIRRRSLWRGTRADYFPRHGDPVLIFGATLALAAVGWCGRLWGDPLAGACIVDAIGESENRE